MRKLIELVYGWVKTYMLKEAGDTGNPKFVASLTGAFITIEKVWAIITAPKE